MKRIVTAYTFNASAKTITFTGFTTLELERILLITNVTRNAIIYNFASTGGTVSTNVLTLFSSINTTGMANADKLQIFYDYPESIGVAGTANTDVSTVQGISGGVPLPVSMASLPAFAATPTVNIGTAPSLTFTNSFFTANAGTNLNTSALAVESGGNLANINSKLPTGLTVSSTRLLIDGSGVTQPVSNSSLSNIDGKLPASLGTKAASASLSVAPAFAATSTLTNVASSTTSVTLLTANNSRKTVIILNDSTSDLYIVWGSSAASVTNYSIFLAGKVGNTPAFTTFSGEDYSGEVRGIWTTANGSARITETS